MTTTRRIIEAPVSNTLHADAAVERLIGLELAADAPSATQVESLRAATLATIRELAADETLGSRLALADTTVEVHIVDARAQSCCFSLLLDREPIDALNGSYPEAEIKLYLTAGDLARFWAGELHAAIAITDGRIGYQGPVRKALRILPLVRRYAPRFVEHHDALGTGRRDVSGAGREW